MILSPPESGEYSIGGIRLRLLDRQRHIFQRIDTSQCYILQKHEYVSDVTLDKCISDIITEYNRNCGHNCSLGCQDNEMSNGKIKGLHEQIHKSRIWKNIITSDSIVISSNDVLALCPVPDNIIEYKSISEIAYDYNLPIRNKILILDNLIEVIITLFKSLPTSIKRVTSECVYINPNDSDVIIILNRCLDIKSKELNNQESSFYLEVTDEVGLCEQQLVRFIAYTAFSLLCKLNPYDVRGSIKQYPLVTKYSAKKINDGKFGFIFSTEGNNMIKSETSEKIWNLLPSFFRNSIQLELESKSSSDKHLTLIQWQSQIRMLRDSLIFVKNRPILYDWEAQHSLLLLKCNDYTIPVWPRKAVYWYHVGLSHSDGDNGIIGGIDAELQLKNSSNILWSVRKGLQIGKGQVIKLEPGMNINIGGQTVQVIAGNNIHNADNRSGRTSGIISVNDNLIDDDIRLLLGE